MAEISTKEVRGYLEKIPGQMVSLDKLRREFNILPATKSFDAIRNIMFQLAEQGIVKSNSRGEYKVIIPIEPIEWSLDGNDQEGVLDFHFPRSYIDDTTFGLEDLIEIFSGDMILITGQSNYGKSCLALSILGENVDLLPCILMGTELTTSKLEITHKLKRRLRRMEWARWIDDKGKPKFDILPVGVDYEEYIRRDYLNVIDWISLPGEYYLIDSVTKTMKDRVGKGILVPVIQKNKEAEFGEGGERTIRYADVELKIDRFGQFESLLTIGKVKSPIGKSPVGKKFAFEIANYGANLQNIREVERCLKCWGKGKVRVGQEYQRCPSCKGLKYIDKLKEG